MEECGRKSPAASQAKPPAQFSGLGEVLARIHFPGNSLFTGDHKPGAKVAMLFPPCRSQRRSALDVVSGLCPCLETVCQLGEVVLHPLFLEGVEFSSPFSDMKFWTPG